MLMCLLHRRRPEDDFISSSRQLIENVALCTGIQEATGSSVKMASSVENPSLMSSFEAATMGYVNSWPEGTTWLWGCCLCECIKLLVSRAQKVQGI